MAQPRNKHTKDKEILRLLSAEPRRGYTLLFHTYYAEVCGHVYRMLPDRAAAEDIAQEMFIELWSKRKSLTIKSSPGAYLRRMAVTRTLNYLRNHKKDRFADDTTLSNYESTLTTPLEAVEASDLEHVITHSIDTLPDRCRKVFVLSRFENMTYKEIAGTLDISVKTVENQMIKALKHLRESMANYRTGR